MSSVKKKDVEHVQDVIPEETQEEEQEETNGKPQESNAPGNSEANHVKLNIYLDQDEVKSDDEKTSEVTNGQVKTPAHHGKLLKSFHPLRKVKTSEHEMGRHAHDKLKVSSHNNLKVADQLRKVKTFEHDISKHVQHDKNFLDEPSCSIPRNLSVKSFYWVIVNSMLEEGDRGREMTAGFDASGATTNGDATKRNEDGVYTLSVTGAYENDGFKGDGDLGPPIKPPRDATDEEVSQQGKFKMSTREKWRILKNVSAISCAFMIQFTAFQGTANLQSSINAKDGLGTLSLSSIFAALVVSCIFVPSFLIKRLTVKWTLCLSMLCYAPYIGAQFYPKFYSLIPAGIIVGIGAAPMWASKATYLTQAASVYAKLTDQAVDAIIVRFFGFFFLAWQTAELWGNLISSLVLSNPHGSSNSSSSTNYDVCGANFCVSNAGPNENLDRPADSEIYEIMGIYLACIFVAVLLIILLVDPLSRYGEKQRRNSAVELTGIQLLSATAYQLKKPYQQLLIPITIYIGVEQAFISADFTQSYVSCAMGVQNVGFVMICFGVVNAICSLLFGSVMKYVGRVPIMILGVCVHAGLQVWLLIWRPHPQTPLAFFMASGLWGVGDAVWQTQVNGLYGALFRRNKEAAFSNYRLWESVGFVVAYAYSTQLCARMKLYVQLAILIIGFLLYCIVEIHHMRKLRRQKEKERKAAELAASQRAAEQEPETTDDEKDDIDDEIIVTHL